MTEKFTNGALVTPTPGETLQPGDITAHISVYHHFTVNALRTLRAGGTNGYTSPVTIHSDGKKYEIIYVEKQSLPHACLQLFWQFNPNSSVGKRSSLSQHNCQYAGTMNCAQLVLYL